MDDSSNDDNSIEEAFNSFVSSQDDGISYGIKSIDYILKGMQAGHFIVLAGRPAMGKTALALNIVRNVCSQKYKVLFFSLEMVKVDLYKRLFACETGMSEEEAKTQISNYVAHGENDKAEKIWEKIKAGKRRVANWSLDIVADAYTLGDIRAKTKLMEKKKGVDLVVIDHLQLMSAPGHKDNRVGELTEITRSLVNLAKDINAPILCLSQINRSNEKNSDKRPLLSDLKESGSIEQDADQVMMIYRDQYYDKDGDDWTEIIVRKNRHGNVGVARLSYDMARNQFTDYKGISGEKVTRSDAKDVREFFDEG
jgi:replicative DNA helicase